jgi:two-component system, NarL family, nitrate/nitrite response regulator NarL
MNVPDYVSPIVAYRVWHWDGSKLRSLNGEPWCPRQPLAARCTRVSDRHQAPQMACTCGIYAAKRLDQLRQLGSAGIRIYGEVCLWGTVVEHELGWRAQFAYPKSWVLPFETIPLSMDDVMPLLQALGVFGVDIFASDREASVRLWTKDSGQDSAGLEWLDDRLVSRIEWLRPQWQTWLSRPWKTISDRTQPIRIVIADGHAIFRDALRRLLEAESSLKVIGEACNGAEAVKLARQLEPDILLLDLSPRLSGLEVLRDLRTSSQSNPVRVILLTAAAAKSEIVEALLLGARGVVLKHSATHLLLKSVHAVMTGEYWMGRESVSNRVEYLRTQMQSSREAPRPRMYGLTPRELEIVSTVVAGYSNKEIAEHYKIREDTVKHHLSNIFDKLGVSTRLELAWFAVNQSLPLAGIARLFCGRPTLRTPERARRAGCPKRRQCGSN